MLFVISKPMKINIIPFGEVEEERFEISKTYKLIEMTGGFWRLTKKCKDNYSPLSYILYLKGEVEVPEKQKTKTAKITTSNKTSYGKNAEIQAILTL